MTSDANVRPPAVAGVFYAAEPQALRDQIQDCYRHPLGPGTLPSVREQPLPGPLGLIVPHASYRYSGPIAAKGYWELAWRGRPEAVVVLGPNHSGIGPDAAVPQAEAWETPLGVATVDRELAHALHERCPFLKRSDAAFAQEHSVEVQVPFLQHLYGRDVPVLPVLLLGQSLKTATALGCALHEVVRDKNVAVVATTDLSHYYPDAIARRKDRPVLDAVLSLKAEAVEQAVREHDVNMCGPGPVMTLLAMMTLLGAPEARRLGYATSGDTSGDREQVVGYCAFLLERP